nr:MAG TPA: hypothetical protein [Crassvirales sp.]
MLYTNLIFSIYLSLYISIIIINTNIQNILYKYIFKRKTY